MKFKINGTNLPTVDIFLEDKEVVFTEAGGMAWMSSNIEMETSTRGGVMKGLGRMLAGESLFLVHYAAIGKAKITFASEFPGKILPLKLEKGQEIIFQKDSFLCAENSVNIDIHLRKKSGAGLFGGEGFILQKATGPGYIFFEIDGEVSKITLKRGELLKVDTGHIALYEPTVEYDFIVVKGVKNVLFGGEGLFFATMNGPGKVWLQSMPIKNLARKLLQYMPITSGGGGKRSGINMGDFLARE